MLWPAADLPARRDFRFAVAGPAPLKMAVLMWCDSLRGTFAAISAMTACRMVGPY
jgi:hypothetical protein